MQKKYFIPIAIIAVLTLGLLYFILSQPKGEQYENIDTIMGVPVNAELIIHIPDLQNFAKNMKNEGVWKELEHWGLVSDFQKKDKELAQTLASSELSELMDNAQLTIATKITGRSSVEYNYIFPLKTENKKKHIEKLLKHFFKNYTQSSRKYSGFKLFHATEESKKNSYFYAFAKGLFILSTSQISIEDALLQISNKNSLLDKKSFQHLKKIASTNDDINIFINGRTFPRLLALSLDDKYSKFIKELTDFTTQAGLDVSIGKDNILINGFLYTNTDDFFYTNMLLNQKPVKATIEEVIPSNTSFWAALTLSDEHAYLDNYKRYLEQTGDSKPYRNFFENFQKQTGLSPEGLIYSLLDSEIGLVISEDKILGENANRYCVLRTKSKSETTKALDSLSQSYASKQKKEHKTISHKVDANLSYTIYPFPFNNFANMMWGGLFFETETNYCTLIDNYLVFANSTASLKRYIDYIVRRKTLKHDTFYQSQKKFWVDDKSSFTAYVRMKDGNFLKKYVNKEYKTAITEKSKNIEKFPSASIQIKAIKDMLYLNGYIAYTSNPQKSPQTVWQSRLDHPLKMKPVMVSNHKAKGQQLILQDTQNILYLVSNAGRILWKLPLNEPILGTIHQVDAYKNNKVQYLFNTKNKLHLIDINGNNVGNFPITFRAKATNGIALFDYDMNRNYRIFVSTEDKQTYLYDIEGRLKKGWESAKNEHHITQPIQYFVNGSKDYIVYNDNYRNYILNRRGEVRALPKQNFNKAKGSQLCVLEQTKQQDCQLVATDTTGTIYFTQLNGKVTTKTFGNFSSQHLFTSYDIDADGKNDFIFVDKGTLYVFSSSGKKIFNYTFDNNTISMPNFYSFSSRDKKIGVQAGNSIFLFNSDGSLYEGFPLEGYSDFTIGFMNDKDRQFNLFVAGNNDLLFNYAVQ